MMFIAEELREIMAELGFRSVDEMIGRVDRLDVRDAIDHWKGRGVDLTPILYRRRRQRAWPRAAWRRRITTWRGRSTTS